MTLVQLFSLSVLSLVALVMSQDIPTSYLLPEPTATSFLLNPTGNLGTSCSQEVLDCMSKLHADCKVDKPKDYMSCACTSRQGGENKCLAVVTEQCRGETTGRTNQYCEASRLMQELNLDTFDPTPSPDPPPKESKPSPTEAAKLEESGSSTSSTESPSASSGSSAEDSSSAASAVSSSGKIVVNPARTGSETTTEEPEDDMTLADSASLAKLSILIPTGVCVGFVMLYL